MRPQLLADEVLSHWLSRVAGEYGMTLEDLVNCPDDPRQRPTNRDLDRGTSAAFAALLMAATGVKATRLAQSVLTRYEGIVFERLAAGGWGQWLVPISASSAGQRRTGQPFCPLCLDSDAIPYFRTAWRLAFHTVCTTHGALLVDACYACDAPVDSAYWTVAAGEVVHRAGRCSKCGAWLGQAQTVKPKRPYQDGVSILLKLLKQFDRGYLVDAPGGPHLYSVLFFEGWRQIVSLLVRPKTGANLLAALSAEGISIRLDALRDCRPPFEGLSIDCRHEVVRLSLLMLDQWPYRFVRICRRAGLTASSLMLDKEVLPFWLARVVDRELSAARYRPNQTEIEQACRYLQRNQVKPSKIQVKRVLGVAEAKAIDAVVMVARDVFTLDETLAFFATFDGLIRNASAARGHRAALARDRTIVLLVALGMGTLEKVCDWSVNNVPATVVERIAWDFDPADPPALFDDGILVPAWRHLAWYVNFVWDSWHKCDPELPRWLFLSRQNRPIHVESVRIRAGTVKRMAGLTGLQSCIDGLTFVTGRFR